VTPQPVTDPGLAPFTAAHDLFGDGSLVLLPTPGHTPGSLSMLIRQPGATPLLMAGDLTYDVHLMQDGHLPGLGERAQVRASGRAVSMLRGRYPDLAILPAHDPAAGTRLSASSWGRVPLAAAAEGPRKWLSTRLSQSSWAASRSTSVSAGRAWLTRCCC
jgi:glyoxylase-like metal-dependent hydrolase (beta-lactamase superfamily II)